MLDQTVVTLNHGIYDFSFVSSEDFLLLTPAGLVEVWHFDDPATSRLGNIPYAKIKFGLPRLAPGFIYWYMSLSANPSTGFVPASSTNTLYHPHPNERVHAFCIYLLNPAQVEGLAHAYVVFVNIQTFLNPSECVREFRNGCHKLEEPIPWEIWGPQHTRWFTERINTDWQHSIYGYRTVEAMVPQEPEVITSPAAKRKLRVRDFNPYALALMELPLPYTESEGWRGRVVREPSKICAKETFAEDVVSQLPYREIISEDAFDVTDVMMDDCRILLLQVRPYIYAGTV